MYKILLLVLYYYNLIKKILFDKLTFNLRFTVNTFSSYIF